ncbi:MAG: RNA polymerase sigma factor [Ignavibacteriae bacterium]|nr:RNA polymerase sigma factor [Ignavibacteriota bacterium]
MENLKEKYFELVKPVLKDLEQFALHITRNRDFSRDLVNETIIEGLSSFSNLNSNGSFKSYMFTIAKRKYCDILKQNRRVTVAEPQQFDELYCKQIGPDELADLNLLYDAMGKISTEQKEAFILSEIMGFKDKEIAKIQGISLPNVKIRIFRARKNLRKLLSIE